MIPLGETTFRIHRKNTKSDHRLIAQIQPNLFYIP